MWKRIMLLGALVVTVGLCAHLYREFVAVLVKSIATSTSPANILMPAPPTPPAPITSPEIRQEQLYELLQTNSNCEFPCFLGITAGKTSFEEGKLVLETYSQLPLLSYSANLEGRNSFWLDASHLSFSKNGYTGEIAVRMRVDKGDIVGLMVDFGPVMREGDRKSVRDQQIFSRYGLTELLQRHGVPDEVYLQPPKAQPPPPASPSRYEWYILDVVYQKQKIFASYPGWAKFSPGQGKYKLCPEIGDGQIDTFSMAFADPALKELNMVEFMWGSFNPYFTLDWYRENMEPLDAKGLYERFIQHGQRCFYEDEYVVEVQEGM